MAIEHLTIQLKDTKVNIEALITAIEAQWYFTTDTDEFYFGKSDGTVAGPVPGTAGFIMSISDTDTISLIETAGDLTANLRIDVAADNIITSSAAGVKAVDMTIHADSQNRMEIVGRELKFKSLGIIDVEVNTVAASLAAFVTSDYPLGNEYQEGDVVILTVPDPTESWIHNGGVLGTVADFTQLSYDVSDTYIRALISGSNALTYTSATGEMKWGGLMTGTTTISQGGFVIHYRETTTGSTVWMSQNPGVSLDMHKGSIEFMRSIDGVILLSADSTRWRVTIANTGALITTAL